MIPPRIYPWAHATTPEDTLKLLGRLERDTGREFGAILVPGNYETATLHPGPWIAKVSSAAHVRSLPTQSISAIIAGDEPNGGTTSPNVDPGRYATAYNEIADAAPPDLPVYRAGLGLVPGPLGTFLSDLLHLRVFDSEYHERLSRILPGTPSAANAGHCGALEFRTVPTDLVTAIPHVAQGPGSTYHAAMDVLRGLTASAIVRASETRPVGIWALRQYDETPWRSKFGIFTTSGREYTSFGRALVRAARR